jgi:hypothetical protein
MQSKLYLGITSTVQTHGGRTVRVRKTSALTADQMDIYQALGISSLPGKLLRIIFKLS